VTHSVADILRVRMLAIACGYEDGNDLDYLRSDPGLRVPVDREHWFRLIVNIRSS
jgi:hypothetical protein